MKILIAFSTVEGHTKKVANFLCEKIQNFGEEVVVFQVLDENSTQLVEDCDAVVLAAPVHERRHPKVFENWLASNREIISKRKSLMISISLKAAFAGGCEEAQDYIDEMKMRTGFKPDHELLVAGAVKSGSYDYFESQIVEHVLLGQHDHSLTETEHEFTNWDRLVRAAADFIEA